MTSVPDQLDEIKQNAHAFMATSILKRMGTGNKQKFGH
jgi:hypothetical protein